MLGTQALRSSFSRDSTDDPPLAKAEDHTLPPKPLASRDNNSDQSNPQSQLAQSDDDEELVQTERPPAYTTLATDTSKADTSLPSAMQTSPALSNLVLLDQSDDQSIPGLDFLNNNFVNKFSTFNTVETAQPDLALPVSNSAATPTDNQQSAPASAVDSPIQHSVEADTLQASAPTQPPPYTDEYVPSPFFTRSVFDDQASEADFALLQIDPDPFILYNRLADRLRVELPDFSPRKLSYRIHAMVDPTADKDTFPFTFEGKIDCEPSPNPATHIGLHWRVAQRPKSPELPSPPPSPPIISTIAQPESKSKYFSQPSSLSSIASTPDQQSLGNTSEGVPSLTHTTGTSSGRSSSPPSLQDARLALANYHGEEDEDLPDLDVVSVCA